MKRAGNVRHFAALLGLLLAVSSAAPCCVQASGAENGVMASAEVKRAEREYKKAQKAYEAAKADASKKTEAREQAEQAEREAKEALTDAGIAFLDANCGEYDRSDNLLARAKDNENLKENGIWKEEEEVVRVFRESLQPEALLHAADLVQEANTLRKNEDLVDGCRGAQKIGCELMLYAALSGAVSRVRHGHTYFQSGASNLAHRENHAWGYSDPFQGWYDREKEIYRRDPDAEWSTVGHYLNIVESSDTDATGIGWHPDTRTASKDWAQETYIKNPMTVREFKNLLKESVLPMQTAAEEAVEMLEAARREEEEAAENVSRAKTDAKAAKKKWESLKYRVSGVKLTLKSRRITVKWAKNPYAGTYQVQMKRTGGAYKTLTRTGRTAYRTSVLSRRKTYTFRIRVVKAKDGTKAVGKWSAGVRKKVN